MKHSGVFLLWRALSMTASLACILSAQPSSPAHWTLAPERAQLTPGSTLPLRLELKLDEPWHMYAVTQPPPGPEGGPIPTTVRLAENPAIAGVRLFQQPPARAYDPNFQMETESYAGGAVFLLHARIAASARPGALPVTVEVRYQLCTDRECLPPRRVQASAEVEIVSGPPAPDPPVPDGFFEVIDGKMAGAPAVGAASSHSPSQASDAPGFGHFLWVAFGFGLAAIFTPCVFPMIPVTVSFFLNRAAQTRRAAVAQAAVFCLGIIVLFTAMGVLVTAVLGPFGAVRLGASPWANGLIAAILFVFALSLLGAFEITVPSGVLTRLDRSSQRGGIAGTLLMGFTFSLAAFACIGPFVGTLLATSLAGDRLTPLFGMLAFATGLALPFFFLALFPSYLKRLPRSGSWMARVKVVLGFLVMAAMVKFLSNADQAMQWNLLTRERFLGLWMVLLAMPGLYLLGWLRMEGVKAEESVGVARALFGCLFLAASLWLLPGMFGARLGELDAYVPPPAEESGLTLSGVGRPQLRWMKNAYEEALVQAREEDKLVFVSFTGYACTNCHWMKANMFTRPEIAAELSRMVLVELYTDGADPASEKNQRMQERMFSTVAIPYYAILDAGGRVRATFPGLTRDASQFLEFLTKAQAGS